MSEHRSREECQGVFVGNFGNFGSGGVHSCNVIEMMSRHEQRHRSHAHDAAATFAVVIYRISLQQALTCRQTGVTRSTELSQFGKVAKPCVVEVVGLELFFATGLCVIPIEIGAIDIPLRLSTNTSHTTTGDAHEHTIGGEERHLRVVAYQSLPLVAQGKPGDSTTAVCRKNAIAAHKFHCISQRIACGTCHQRATDAVFCSQFHIFFIRFTTSYKPTHKIYLLLCFGSLAVCRFGHHGKTVSHKGKSLLRSGFFHISGFIARHYSTCTPYTTPAMNISVSALLYTVFNLVDELMHSLDRLRHTYIPNGETQIGGVAGQ